MSTDNNRHQVNNRNGDKKRRLSDPFRPAWKRAKDLPAFLDASATVSASTYGARRLPELRALWNATTTCNNDDHRSVAEAALIPTEETLKSSGNKTSSRHLRRRTTSHKRRKRHRYPAGPPPVLEKISSESNTDENTPKSRHSRRKKTFILCQYHENWRTKGGKSNLCDNTTVTTTAVTSNTTCTTIDKTVVNWMTTHLWHCKRFHMANLWGWQIPMVHTNRGPKAALRLIREGKTLIQDVTWKMGTPLVMMCTSGSSKSLLTIQSAIQRICPNFQLSVTDESLLSTGRGMIHALDQFPQRAIGPMSWLVCRRRPLMGTRHTSANTDTDTDTVSDDNSKQQSFYYIYVWIEPCIQHRVQIEFLALHRAMKSSYPEFPDIYVGFASKNGKNHDSSGTGMTCFQLRGINATKALVPFLDTTSPVPTGNQRLLNNDKVHTDLPNMTVIPILLTLPNSKSSSSIVDNDNNNSLTMPQPWIENCRALAVSYCVSDPTNLPQNAPGIGWDVYCDAQIAKDFFVQLVLTSQACPIGVVEEAFIKLECHPPIATVFPRDFPDTDEGRKYWQLGTGGNTVRFHSNDNDVKDKSLADLQTLRLCLEDGEAGGRVDVPTIKKRSDASAKGNDLSRISNNRVCSITWRDVVNPQAASNYEEDFSKGGGLENASSMQSANVVMMRGMFGKPLVDALSGSGKIASGEVSVKKAASRKRRRGKRPNEVCHVIPLSRDEADDHITNTTTLLQSLSLPAVVACRLNVVGTGTLHPGAQIYSRSSKNEGSLLGYVTSGGFSVARGAPHGLGVMGASRLLEAIIDACSSVQQMQHCLAVVQDYGSRRIHLLVNIKNGKHEKMKATMALSL